MLPYLRIILIILLIGFIYWAITSLKKPVTPMNEAFENDMEETEEDKKNKNYNFIFMLHDYNFSLYLNTR